MYNNLMDSIGFIANSDPEVAEAMNKELARQRRNLELIASENFTSKAVMAACGTVLTNKYAEGKPHKRFYNGCEVVDKIEELADMGTIYIVTTKLLLNLFWVMMQSIKWKNPNFFPKII